MTLLMLVQPWCHHWPRNCFWWMGSQVRQALTMQLMGGCQWGSLFAFDNVHWLLALILAASVVCFLFFLDSTTFSGCRPLSWQAMPPLWRANVGTCYKFPLNLLPWGSLARGGRVAAGLQSQVQPSARAFESSSAISSCIRVCGILSGCTCLRGKCCAQHSRTPCPPRVPARTAPNCCFEHSPSKVPSASMKQDIANICVCGARALRRCVFWQ
jgi:hypothetical protein